MRRLAGLATVLALVAFPAFGQDGDAPLPDAPSATEEDAEVITVIGQRREGLSLERYASAFVLEIADAASPGNGYARWDDRICVGVENIAVDGAQFIADRIAEVAIEVGLRPQGPGCTPNISIIFATDAALLATRWVEERPATFRPFHGVGGTTQGLGSLERFTSSDAPVRWWQITMPVDMRGRPAVELPGTIHGPPVIAGGNSHIVNLLQDALWATYVIVDATKVDGRTWTQLADYLAMVSLAQIDPGGSAAGYDTILNLFESSAPPRGLTDWDRSYLTALYDLDRRLLPRMQKSALANSIARHQQDGTLND